MDTESSLEDKNLGVVVNEKLSMICQYALAPRKPTIPWAAPKETWPAG